MSKMNPGTWCRPTTEKEWKAVLDIADSLGLKRRLPTFEETRRNYEQEFGKQDKLIMDAQGIYATAACYVDGRMQESVPEFIAAMYAEAEARKTEERLKEGDRIYAKGKPEIWQDHDKRIERLEKVLSLVEYHNRQIDRLDSHMIEAEKRLKDLGVALAEPRAACSAVSPSPAAREDASNTHQA